LTRALLNSGAKKVLAIERDERLIPALNQIKDHFDNRLEVKYADALNENIEAYLNGPVKVVANLPYNIGTELLVRWLTPSVWPPYWESLTLMFQKEVAKRIVATPGSKAYGRLALLVQWRCDAKIVMEISPQAFTPPPKVTSAVVHIPERSSQEDCCHARIKSLWTLSAISSMAMRCKNSNGNLSPSVHTSTKSDISCCTYRTFKKTKV